MNGRWINVYYNVGTNTIESGEHTYATQKEAIEGVSTAPGFTWLYSVKIRLLG